MLPVLLACRTHTWVRLCGYSLCCWCCSCWDGLPLCSPSASCTTCGPERSWLSEKWLSSGQLSQYVDANVLQVVHGPVAVAVRLLPFTINSLQCFLAQFGNNDRACGTCVAAGGHRRSSLHVITSINNETKDSDTQRSKQESLSCTPDSMNEWLHACVGACQAGRVEHMGG